MEGRGRATIAIGLRPRDRTFLNDYVRFGYLHHVIVAEALRATYQHADDAAARTREQVERIERQAATDMAERLNDGARVQTVCVARLLSELASALEDLGALIHAIRHRSRRGVMAEYLEAGVRPAAAAYDLLLKGGGFVDLLRLPEISGLSRRLETEAMRALEHDYATMATTLGQMAAMYRDRPAHTTVPASGQHPPDRVAIVLDVDHATSRRGGGLLVQAHNKIKHRFTVIEDIEALTASEDAGIRYGHYPRDQASVMRLVQDITQVALASAELAALVLTIDRSASSPRRDA